MSEILAQSKSVAVPGELLAKGMDCIPSFGTYREGENVYASRMGLVNISGKVLKIIPLNGAYVPKRGDVIIGQVKDVLVSGWKLELNSAYIGILSLKDGTSEFVARGADLTKYYELGDYLMVSVINVTSQKLIDLSMRGPGLRKLNGGRIIKVSSQKVPRVIGKHGSMVSMIKTATDCKILVGQNGIVWLSGEPSGEVLVEKAIKMIEEQAHVSGLTDSIKEFLEKETGTKIDLASKNEEKDNVPNQN
jgi:exosome complex component RRP4